MNATLPPPNVSTHVPPTHSARMQQSERPLVRPLDDRKIGGVCAALADRFGWNRTTVRVLTAVSVLLPGPQLIAYLVAWIVVGSILFGRKLDEEEKVGREMIAAPPAEAAYAGIGSGSITIPGTLVMVSVFFAAFALYYFINWKYLAETWGIS